MGGGGLELNDGGVGDALDVVMVMQVGSGA